MLLRIDCDWGICPQMVPNHHHIYQRLPYDVNQLDAQCGIQSGESIADRKTRRGWHIFWIFSSQSCCHHGSQQSKLVSAIFVFIYCLLFILFFFLLVKSRIDEQRMLSLKTMINVRPLPCIDSNIS